METITVENGRTWRSNITNNHDRLFMVTNNALMVLLSDLKNKPISPQLNPPHN